MKNLIRALRPLYITSKIFGLAPFTPKGDLPVFHTTKGDRIYSFVWLVLMIVNMIVSVKERTSTETFISTIFMNDILEIVLASTSAVLTLFLWLTVNHSRIEIILNFITKADKILVTDNETRYKRMFRFLLVQSVIIKVLLPALFTIDAYVWSRTMKKLRVFYFIAPYPCYIINIITDFQLSNLALYIRARFKIINERLQQLSVHETRRTGLDIESFYQKKMWGTAFLNNNRSSRTLPKSVLVNSIRHDSCVDTIHTLREMYDVLCDIASLTNKTYGLPVLSSIAATFTHFITTVYMILALKLHYQAVAQDMLWLLIYVLLTWALLHVADLLFLTASCSAASSEAGYTPVLVHKLLLLRNPLDQEIVAQLQLFSQELLHRKVVFTAFGFFRIDFTILISISGAVTTYLVIYLQFNNY